VIKNAQSEQQMTNLSCFKHKLTNARREHISMATWSLHVPVNTNMHTTLT